MPTELRCFVNERPVTLAPGATVRDAVQAFDPALAAKVAAGGAYVTDARALLAAGCWAGAYYLAGYALECALKACILKFVEATGNVRAPKVKVGDKVIYGQYSGSAYKQDGVEYKIIKEDDVLAILG